MEPPVQKYPEVQAAIIHHSAAIMVAVHKGICHLAGDHYQINFFTVYAKAAANAAIAATKTLISAIAAGIRVSV